MPEIADTIAEVIEERKSESRLNTLVAVAVAATATIMALCNVKAGNISQSMSFHQSKAVDTWSFFQAKSTKGSLAESVLEQLTLQVELAGDSVAPAVRQHLAEAVEKQKRRIAKYESEKQEIRKQAEEHEAKYDQLGLRDDQFDMADALFSMALALFGITALTQKRSMLLLAATFATFGIIMGIAGFAGWGLHPTALATFLG